MAIYALKNATDPKSKDAVLAAMEKMKFDSIVGPIDFTAPIIAATGTGPADWPAGPGHKTKNVYDHGLGGSQWLIQGGKWKFDSVPVDKAAAPYMTRQHLQADQAAAGGAALFHLLLVDRGGREPRAPARGR